MRAASLAFALAGCGPVLLGEERELDAAVRPPEVEVAVAVATVGCDGCFELRASGRGGQPPYRFQWDDGSEASTRQLCPAEAVASVGVSAIDADGRRSVTAVTHLTFPDASCPVAPAIPLLCIENPSFEGKPAVNDGNPANFDGAPWVACPAPQLNTPDIGNDSIEQPWAETPKTPHGETFAGIQEGEQLSQKLCEPVEVGTTLYLQFDAQRLYIGGGVTPDTELPFLEIWGGLAANCSQQQLLWASEPLPASWKTYCAELRPQEYMDQLTLRARADESLPTLAYLLVDNLVPVERCP